MPAATEKGARAFFDMKNAVAVVLVVSVVSVSIATRGPQVHGRICFFNEATCEEAQRVYQHHDSAAVAPGGSGEPDEPQAPAAPVCRMADILKLMACKGGGFTEKCCLGYHHFYSQNCVCAYDAWPRQYVGDDMNAFNWVRNIMLCNMSYAEVAQSSSCVQQLDTCPDPVEGDVRLASHPRGLLLLWRDGEWGRVRGPGLTGALATSTCRRLGYASAADRSDSAATALLYEHDLPTDSDRANGTNQSLSVMRIGIPARVHDVDCVTSPAASDAREQAKCPLLKATQAGDASAASSSSSAASRAVVHPVVRPQPSATLRTRIGAAARPGRGPVDNASGGDGGASGAWVLSCQSPTANGATAPGPQSCWLGRDGSRQCGGDATAATLACGTSAGKRRSA